MLVIADDLSGATDAGVQFARRGIPACVVIDWRAELVRPFNEFEVVVVDARSRHLSPEDAARRVRDIARRGVECGAEYLFKKTDSTLRGNVGAELAALLVASGERSLAFCPASPQLGRTTRDGIQYVHGRPLHETSFATDPFHPMRESGVARLLASQTSLPISHVRVAELPKLGRHVPPGLVIFDAESVTDVTNVIEAADRADALHAMAGPAAIAGFAAEHLPMRAGAPPETALHGPLLIVNGSLNPASTRQCDRAIAAGASEHRLASELLAGDSPDPAATWKLVAAVAADIATGRIPVLRSDRTENPRSTAADHHHVSVRLGQLTARILATRRVATLAIIGGDTLAGFCEAMAWREFIALGEIEPGMAISAPMESPEARPDPLHIISKPGGYGDDDTLVRIVGALRG